MAYGGIDFLAAEERERSMRRAVEEMDRYSMKWGNGLNTLLREGDPIKYASMSHRNVHQNCSADYIKDGECMCKDEYDKRCQEEHDKAVREAYRHQKTATEAALMSGRTLRGIRDMVRTNLTETQSSGASGAAITMESMNMAINNLLSDYYPSSFATCASTPWAIGYERNFASLLKDDRTAVSVDTEDDMITFRTEGEKEIKYDQKKMEWTRDTKAHDLFWAAYSKTGKLPFEASCK
jgi:hypothetical protein